MPIHHVKTDTYEFSTQDKINKSNEFAPKGYTWVGNTPKILCKEKDCLTLETAYDIYGNYLKDCYALYKRL